ncbi:MAG: peptide deformylase [Candidatus Gracilibacteria bacterium]|nr:peptide deformylase [Candidatus Gracilibacteria bacterium]
MLKVETGSDNQILRTKSVPIPKIVAKHQALIDEMRETMQREDGVGLAAPQVGQNIRLILVTLVNAKERAIVPMINPEILRISEKEVCLEEGCLSLPGKFAEVLRSEEITLKYINTKGQEKILSLSGMNARVVLHEIDHLDGILFIDRMVEHIGPLQKLKSKLYL